MRTLVVICIALLWVQGSCSAKTSIDITAEKQFALVNENFKFKCSETGHSFTNLNLLVNGSATYDRSRVTNTTASNKRSVDFTFKRPTKYENGTTFQCVENGRQSDVLTMKVAYIEFHEESAPNGSIWVEQMTDSSFILSCRATANPPIVSINGTNSSKKFDNVEFQSNVTEGMFNVTNAQESNRGNYTCTASNGVVTSNLTYNTFIGGAPTDVNITGIGVISDLMIITIRFNFTDKSPAPAEGVKIHIKGLVDINYPFGSPNMGGPFLYTYLVKDKLNSTVPGMYDVSITPYNSLGNGTAVMSKHFINGRNFTVKINTTHTTVVQYTNMTVNCTSNSKYANVSLLLDGFPAKNLSNVVELFHKNGTASYVVSVIYPYQNGNIFKCVGKSRLLKRESSPFTLIELYAPVFRRNNETKLNEYAPQSNFTLSCTIDSFGNPPGKLMFMQTSNESNIRITNTSEKITYQVQNATTMNKDNFTCIAKNSIGQSHTTNLAYVGGPPDVKVTVEVAVDQSELVTLNLNVVDNSDAPATEYIVGIAEISYMHLIVPPTIPPKSKQVYTGLLRKSLSLFGNSTFRVVVIAVNKIDEAVAFNKTLNVPVYHSTAVVKPTNAPSTKHTPTPAPTSGLQPWMWAVIGVGIVAIVVVVIAIGVGVYWYRNKYGKSEYTPLQQEGLSSGNTVTN